MKLPAEFQNNTKWTLVGPMGPTVPQNFYSYPLIGIDGGARYCQKMDIWVGDGDSHVQVIKSSHIFKFPPKKNISDLGLALSLFETSAPLHFHCWGLLGGRRDHELMNLGEMLAFLGPSSNQRASFYDSQGQIAVEVVSPGSWSFNHQGIFSLASVKKSLVSLTGHCEYTLPTPSPLTALSSLGLSNVAFGEFNLSTNSPLLIFFSGEN